MTERRRTRVEQHLLPDVQFVVGVDCGVGQLVEDGHADAHVGLVLGFEGEDVVDVLVRKDGQVGVAVGSAPEDGEFRCVGGRSWEDGDLEVRLRGLAPA